MAYFAQLDQNDNVIQVVVADQDFINSGALGDPASFVETVKGQPGYAGIGMKYNRQRGDFRPEAPHTDWIWSEDMKTYVPENQVKINYTYTENTPLVWDSQVLDWVETSK